MDRQPTPVRADRRKSKRLRLEVPIQALPAERPTAPIAGRVRDISASGIAFETDSGVGCGQALTLVFPAGPGELAQMSAAAVVTRSEVEPESASFVVGLSFVGLEGAERRRLGSALRRCDVVGLLRKASEVGASDLHLSADHPPILRVGGKLRSLGTGRLSSLDLRVMIGSLLDAHQLRSLEQGAEVNLMLAAGEEERYRGNVHLQRGNVEAAFRRIESRVKSIAELNLPGALRQFAELSDGLVLVSGPTGSGKTTAVAAMIDHINKTREAVVITLEAPIEHLHHFKRSIIKQREVGLDTRSYSNALSEAMRQDPDVLVIGEIRDAETMQTAIDAAGTGHLVICTIPAGDCVSTILRVLHFFPAELQQAVRSQLANCLKGIVSLRLTRSQCSGHVVPAAEILTGTHSVANMIRRGTFHQINHAIQTGAGSGMRPFAKSVRSLRKDGHLQEETGSPQPRSIQEPRKRAFH